MKAVLLPEAGRVEVTDVPETPPGPGEVLVEVARAGICGSDLHHFFGRWKPPKVAPGHEVAGRIAAVGPGVEGWAVGNRVTAECHDHCGQCDPCGKGLYNHCDHIKWGSGSGHGAMAERATCYASALYSIEGLTDDQGVLVEPLAVAIHAVARLGTVSDRHVLIIGAGTIGLLCGLAARALGARRVTLLARYEHQRAVAAAMGMGDARFELDDRMRVPCVIDSVGTAETFTAALAHCATRGALVQAGCMTGTVELRPASFLSREIRVTGSRTYAYSQGRRDFDRAIEWLEQGVVDPLPVITHRFPLSSAEQAFQAAADKSSGSVKVLLIHHQQRPVGPA